MRILFLMLALANAAFFAYTWLGSDTRAGGDSQIVSQQLNREKIRLLAPQQVSVLTRKPESPKVAAGCLEWGALVGAEAARAEQALEPLALGAKLTQRKIAEVAGYWVYMPPLANRQAATQKTGELKRLGVEDYFIVSDDPKWRNAVSLGVFKTEEAAIARLAALRVKGVRTAVVGPRDAQPGRTYFQVHDASAALVAKLNELKQDFPDTELGACAAEENKG